MTIVVIDDDPTGSQTVHSCPLLLRWDVDTLRRGLRHPSPLLFVLANTRALPPEAAAARNREIVAALDQALQREELDPSDLLLVSRGDSTLRGHGVLEPQVLAQELADRLGAVQATLHVPAFLPGGRTTVDGEHRLHGQPVHTTPSRDGSFGFSTSHLDAWLEEKSAGAIPAASVLRLTDSRAPLRHGARTRRGRNLSGAGGLAAGTGWQSAGGGGCGAPGAAGCPGGCRVGVAGAATFLFRSAASLINGLVDGGASPWVRSRWMLKGWRPCGAVILRAASPRLVWWDPMCLGRSTAGDVVGGSPLRGAGAARGPHRPGAGGRHRICCWLTWSMNGRNACGSCWPMAGRQCCSPVGVSCALDRERKPIGVVWPLAWIWHG